MLSKFTDAISIEFIFAILAASGGIARVVTGTSNDPKVSWWGEVGRILFVAMPVGIIAGMWVLAEYNSEVMSLAACFSAGVVSLNVVRFLVSNEGLNYLKSFLGAKK